MSWHTSKKAAASEQHSRRSSKKWETTSPHDDLVYLPDEDRQKDKRVMKERAAARKEKEDRMNEAYAGDEKVLERERDEMQRAGTDKDEDEYEGDIEKTDREYAPDGRRWSYHEVYEPNSDNE